MNENRLKMNGQKTELMLLGSIQQCMKCDTIGINVTDDKVVKNKVTKIWVHGWMKT